MQVEVTGKKEGRKDIIYKFQVQGKSIMILFLYHAVERMKIKYSPEADILVIELKKGTLSDSIDLKEGIILHLNEKGEPLEIEILDASKVTSVEEITMLTPIRKLTKT